MLSRLIVSAPSDICRLRRYSRRAHRFGIGLSSHSFVDMRGRRVIRFNRRMMILVCERTEMLTKNLTAENSAAAAAFKNDGYAVFPGFCDVHVHFREPGFSYKETIRTGTLAAAHGGYTDVCTMPNLSPVPDSLENLRAETDIIDRDACVRVHPYGAITKGEKGAELADMDALAPKVIAFSDDGRGVQDEGMMRAAMKKAALLGKIIAAHCEVDSLVRGGCVNECTYAFEHGIAGISNESEWREIERDVKLADETGCSFHICHISTKESVSIIRDAKQSGVDVTCETAPHYLLLDDSFLEDDGRFKMNPPLRDRRDREALVEAAADGTIDIIATDHAPHTPEEKSRGLEKSPFGIVGIETAFPLLYTGLVLKGEITLPRLLEMLTDAPRRRFGITEDTGFTVFDLETEYAIDPREFLSMGKSTPFEGMRVKGKCIATYLNGEYVYGENA